MKFAFVGTGEEEILWKWSRTNFWRRAGYI